MLFNTVSLIIGIAGLSVAAFAYFRPRRRRRLVYQMALLRYFDKNDYTLPEYAEMTYEGTEVERLTKVTVILWNRGTDTLHGNEIVSSDPIRLSVPEGTRILDVEIAKRTREANKCMIQQHPPGGHDVVIRYDYLDPRDGLALNLLHDGATPLPEILGTATGLGDGPDSLGVVHLESSMTNRAKQVSIKQFNILAMALAVALFSGALASDTAFLWLKDFWGFAAPIMSLIAGALLGLVLGSRKVGRRKYPRSLDVD